MCESESRLARARESGGVGDVAQASRLACVETPKGREYQKDQKVAKRDPIYMRICA